jgi:hypothetical protein
MTKAEKNSTVLGALIGLAVASALLATSLT